MTDANPFLALNYELAWENLGDDYYDPVPAAEFPEHQLRFRNNDLLPRLGLSREQVQDEDFIEAFGRFCGVRPFLALRYHGYQFGAYNSRLGDGRGFIYGQVRGTDGNLYDFGTKGSGQTPYSRTADGRLTLKGGVREVLAAEALHQLGVRTSRCLSLIETGEMLFRQDEPSPTRSSVMVRFSRSHIRFGTFERLAYLQRPDLIEKLLDHVIAIYYAHLTGDSAEKRVQFYRELVERVAQLAAQWMVAGFCHAVLNTDNMSITGESFDYGPYAFIPTYDPRFTAAYFDYNGRYSYGNQPLICRLNLELLQRPLGMVMSKSELEEGLKGFSDAYEAHFAERFLRKLGFVDFPNPLAPRLITDTLRLLQETQIPYHGFFADLSEQCNRGWLEFPELILENTGLPSIPPVETWRETYYQALLTLPQEAFEQQFSETLRQCNPRTALLRPVIEDIWEPIVAADNWQPFYELLSAITQRK
ncbi:MAG: YdiU family protein [Cyanobacteria bacterium P01_H01_bin.15]